MFHGYSAVSTDFTSDEKVCNSKENSHDTLCLLQQPIMNIKTNKQTGPLVGLKVLELAGIGPGPLCAMLLADMGADVLRIDRNKPSGLGTPRPGKYDLLRRNRPSVSVDLKNPGESKRSCG